jgi:hypothetical protein
MRAVLSSARMRGAPAVGGRHVLPTATVYGQPRRFQSTSGSAAPVAPSSTWSVRPAARSTMGVRLRWK